MKKDMGDKLFYQNQLKHMTRRLSKNQMAFDAYLAGMEEAYNDCVKEYDEVKLLQRQLDAGNTQAMFQLQDTKAQLEEETLAGALGCASGRAVVIEKRDARPPAPKLGKIASQG